MTKIPLLLKINPDRDLILVEKDQDKPKNVPQVRYIYKAGRFGVPTARQTVGDNTLSTNILSLTGQIAALFLTTADQIQSGFVRCRSGKIY